MFILTCTDCRTSIGVSTGGIANCTLATPLQAPLWAVVASLTHARRILEVGCGQGYTAANMASAAGPDCRVDTIEENPQHAALAEEAFQLRDSPIASTSYVGEDKTSFQGSQTATTLFFWTVTGANIRSKSNGFSMWILLAMAIAVASSQRDGHSSSARTTKHTL